MSQPPNEQQPSPSEARPVLSGVLRGLKFGGFVGAAFWGLLFALSLLVMAFVPRAREDIDVSDPLAIARLLGGTLGGLLITAFYGAMAGATVMGIGAAIAARRAGVGQNPAENADK